MWRRLDGAGSRRVMRDVVRGVCRGVDVDRVGMVRESMGGECGGAACTWWGCAVVAFLGVGVVGALIGAHGLCVQEGDGMGLLDVEADAFSTWLIEHEGESVGCPRWCFQTPLAAWLSEMTGHVYGVDGGWYGRVAWDFCRWMQLPRWAHLFSLWMERSRCEVVTGQEAFETLAAVEWSLAQWAKSGGVSCRKQP